jgi:transglutaminase-like putative cysteine protease
MQEYLKSTDIIDWKHPLVLEQALKLSNNLDNPIGIAKCCFEWVRDEIYHSSDFQMNPVTLKASEVLENKTGFCYAKSHLLAAFLRANGIPSGLCYQRLSVYKNGPPFCLHGLNAVFLPRIEWYRIDARGNREGIYAQFDPPAEQLAFTVKLKGEADLPEIWPEPLPIIVNTLSKYKKYEDILSDLPDIPLI